MNGPDRTPGSVFSYTEAFSRNIGWITEWEQLSLRGKKVAVAGMGGVGGVHLLTLARMGIGAFHIADLDRFELANFNRQIGATLSTIGQSKVDVLARMAHDINPEIQISVFDNGVTTDNLEAFLDGADLFVDGFDFFVLDMRAKVFARCAERGIPAITAAPLGLGTGYIVFLPGGMSFEEYFRLDGLPLQQKYANFFMGLVPRGLQRPYLMDPTRLDLAGQRGPSSVTACQLCAGVVGIEALKILLGRGPVRAAPWFHQFDGYRGRWVKSKLRGGNRNWLQRLKLKAAYKQFGALSRQAWTAPARTDGPEIEQILDLARWAPSGDNTQPWRFEIVGADRLTIHVRDQADHDIYDYNGGQPSLLSAGALLETMRIAASEHGRLLWWNYEGSSEHDHRILVQLPKVPGVTEDPLRPYVHVRSVDRRSYRFARLSAAQRQQLTAALGDEFNVHWFETRGERWLCSRINGLATDIRLRIPEAFEVHKRVIDWWRRRSPVGIPAAAIGLDAVTLKIMRWAMRDWGRMDRMNRMPGGTLMARLQMDYVPGLASAAHFAITAKAVASSPDDRVHALLRTGQAIQRFWLTATQMGLAMQPSLAPLCFAFLGRNKTDFTADLNARRRAAKLAVRVEQLCEGASANLVFLGRLGWPTSRQVSSRSVRRPLEDLLKAPARQPTSADAQTEVFTAKSGASI